MRAVQTNNRTVRGYGLLHNSVSDPTLTHPREGNDTDSRSRSGTLGVDGSTSTTSLLHADHSAAHAHTLQPSPEHGRVRREAAVAGGPVSLVVAEELPHQESTPLLQHVGRYACVSVTRSHTHTFTLTRSLTLTHGRSLTLTHTHSLTVAHSRSHSTCVPGHSVGCGVQLRVCFVGPRSSLRLCLAPSGSACQWDSMG